MHERLSRVAASAAAPWVLQAPARYRACLLIDTESESLGIECLQSAEAFDQLRAIWQTLERLDTRCTPFNTWSWNHLWWQHQASPRDSLALLVVREGRRVVAIAPFYLQSSHLCGVIPLKCLRFVGSGGTVASHYLDLIAVPNRRDAAERAVMQYLRQMKGWQKLILSDVDETSTLVRRAAEFRALLPGMTMTPHAHRLRKAVFPDTVEAFHAQSGPERQGQIQRWLSQLDVAGRWERVLCASNEEMLEASDALFALSRHRLENGQGHAAFCQRADEQFYRALIRRFFADDALWLAVIKLDGRIMAVLCAFLWRGELLFVHSDCAAEHEDLKPLAVLSQHVVERAIEQGLSGFDMLAAEGACEFLDAREANRMVDITCVRPGVLALLDAASRRLQR